MKKKKIEAPLPLRIIAKVFPKVEKIAPWLAKRWFVKIFFTPVRFKRPYGETEAAAEAVQTTIVFEGKKVQVYQWGEGKPILFVHGWMGRGTQFRKFIPIFNNAGYQVVSFDAVGHGQSEGKMSHLVDIVEVIKKVSHHYGGFEMIVGHSLGGVASMIAIHEGLNTERLVMISSPTLGYKIIDVFVDRFNASEKCRDYLNQYVIDKFGKDFEEYSATHIARELRPIDLLLIYDKEDKEVDFENPEALLSVYSNARLITTEGLGHTRILKDETVIDACLQFIEIPEAELTA